MYFIYKYRSKSVVPARTTRTTAATAATPSAEPTRSTALLSVSTTVVICRGVHVGRVRFPVDRFDTLAPVGKMDLGIEIEGMIIKTVDRVVAQDNFITSEKN